MEISEFLKSRNTCWLRGENIFLVTQYSYFVILKHLSLPKGYHLDVVGGPSTPHDPESDAGGSLSYWQGHPSR
jgi:hypothetical protein